MPQNHKSTKTHKIRIINVIHFREILSFRVFVAKKNNFSGKA